MVLEENGDGFCRDAQRSTPATCLVQSGEERNVKSGAILRRRGTEKAAAMFKEGEG